MTDELLLAELNTDYILPIVGIRIISYSKKDTYSPIWGHCLILAKTDEIQTEVK